MLAEDYASNGPATFDALSVSGLGDSKDCFHIQPSIICSREDDAFVSRSTCKGTSRSKYRSIQIEPLLGYVVQTALRSFVSPLLFVLHRLGTCMLHHGNDCLRHGLASFASSFPPMLDDFMSAEVGRAYLQYCGRKRKLLRGLWLICFALCLMEFIVSDYFGMQKRTTCSVIAADILSSSSYARDKYHTSLKKYDYT
jgi:hypothetical protein